MAVNVNQTVEWRAGAGTPVKYSFSINAQAEVVGSTSTTISVRLWGNLSVTNHPTNSRNTWPASDFAVLTLGGYDPADYQFTQGTSYYEAALPTLPNAPQSYLDAMLVEFRGDTYISDGANRSSLWIKNSGVVLNSYSAEGTQTFPINLTFTVTLTGDREQPILIWNSSGASNSTSYGWLTHQVWLSLIDLDYRPGAILNSSNVWLSHNRSGGTAHVLGSDSKWREMRTINGLSASDNPPSIRLNNKWFNQRKIGKE